MIKPEKLSKEVTDILNYGMHKEFDHMLAYRGAANWCNNNGFFKAAEFFAKEAEEEFGHAKKYQDFMTDWNVTPEIPNLDQPTMEFDNLCDVIETIYGNEIELFHTYQQNSTELFNSGEIAVFDFMQFYRKAQTDSVKTYSDMLNILVGTKLDDKFQMLMLEKKLF
jgi:ferritin